MFNHKGEKVSDFKMMAKVIGKNGIFLKQIKNNCADAFQSKIKHHMLQGHNMLRIELTKVFNERQFQEEIMRQQKMIHGGLIGSDFKDYSNPEDIQF